MNRHAEYWINSSNHDLDVAESLFLAGKYDWCLFIGHLVLEKLFKAFYAENMEKFPPRIHDLVRLADLAAIEFDDETLEFLDATNTFNISTWYPDEKLRFYKMCTHDFAKNNFLRIKEIRKWLLKKI